jgi:hypothetical protein
MSAWPAEAPHRHPCTHFRDERCKSTVGSLLKGAIVASVPAALSAVGVDGGPQRSVAPSRSAPSQYPSALFLLSASPGQPAPGRRASGSDLRRARIGKSRIAQTLLERISASCSPSPRQAPLKRARFPSLAPRHRPPPWATQVRHTSFLDVALLASPARCPPAGVPK